MLTAIGALLGLIMIVVLGLDWFRHPGEQALTLPLEPPVPGTEPTPAVDAARGDLGTQQRPQAA
jgi:hypothetical protein